MSASTPLPYVTPGSPQGARKPRLWTGVLIVIAQWALIKVPGWVAPQTMAQYAGMMWGPIIGLLGLLAWWLLLSRLSWRTRLIGLGAFLAGALGAWLLADRSIRMALSFFALPLALTFWGLLTPLTYRPGERGLRRTLVVALLLTWGFFTLLRLDGLYGNIDAQLAFRWQPTAEQRYLARLRESRPTKSIATSSPTTGPTVLSLSAGDWPAFRGPHRDGRLAGVSIRTDWAQRPPKQLWRHPVGPGWSSFCVVGDRAFTQEQRDAMEVVTCYRVSDGQELWAAEDAARFSEAIAGPGPRATPTFADGRVYAFGASGHLSCLDALSGRLIWRRNVAAETRASMPDWGFSASPLVTGGLVSVVTGAAGKAVAAYDAASGAMAWSAGDGWSYCSPQLSRLAGVEQILYVSREGLAALDPASGQMLWQHTFAMPRTSNRVTQPAVLDGDDVLFGAAFGVGSRRVHVSHDGSQWKSQEVWTSRAIRPYYNDMVIHKGHAFGFDGNIFVCVDLRTGQPTWRVPRVYGNGQVLLLSDQDLLLVLAEKGRAALVAAKPGSYQELAGFEAIEGKTWNHPVVSRGNLLVRNGEEAACYSLE